MYGKRNYKLICKKNDYISNFIIKTPLSLDYEEHKYIRLLSVKKDLKSLSKKDLKKKLINYKYRYYILLEFGLKEEILGTHPELLKKYFISLFGDDELDFNNIDQKEKNILINKIRKKII